MPAGLDFCWSFVEPSVQMPILTISNDFRSVLNTRPYDRSAASLTTVPRRPQRLNLEIKCIEIKSTCINISPN